MNLKVIIDKENTRNKGNTKN